MEKIYVAHLKEDHAFFDNRKFEFWILKLKGIYIINNKPFTKKYIAFNTFVYEPFDMSLFWIILITIDQIFHIIILAIIALLF